MWKLNEPNDEQLNNYCSLLETSLKKRLEVNVTDIHIKALLINEIHDLLIKKPEELFSLNNQIMRKIIPSYNFHELSEFLKVKNKKEDNLQPYELTLKNKYKDILSNLLNWMGYQQLIVAKKDVSYQITAMKGRNTCTYCNRQYTQTVIEEDSLTGERAQVVRPQLDHWFSKELFPLLSLSFYNLIPSCSICNSSSKGNTIFELGKHIHPYLDDGRDFTFHAIHTGAQGWQLNIVRPIGGIEDNTIKAFHLDEIYAIHSQLEVKDIMEFAEANNTEYLKDLYKNVLHDLTPEKSPQEVYRLLFGTEWDESKHLDRPLSKLKRDILKQVGIE